MEDNIFLVEGSYGCIFSPYITCKGKPTDNYDYLSKIQEKDFYSENEIEMGQLIIKNLAKLYKRFFVPAVYHCGINIKEFKHPSINKCSIIRRKKENKFILLKIPFIGYKNHYISYQDYVVQDINDREILLNLINGYQHLLHGLNLLQKGNLKLCHFDLNSTNILFSEDEMNPVIIDFGLSFSIPKLKHNLEKYFFIYYPKCWWWSLEVHYINYLLYENSSPSHQNIISIAKAYVKYNTPLQQNFSPTFIKNYEESCVHILEKYADGTDEIMDIINLSWKTWDNYALSLMYLQIIFYLNITFRDGKALGAFTQNEFITHLTKLLLTNIHPDPSYRSTLEQTINDFDLFFYNTNVNDVSNYEDILNKYATNKQRLKKIVFENQKDLRKLLKRIGKTRSSRIRTSKI